MTTGYTAALDELDDAHHRIARLEQQLAEKDREIGYLRQQLDEAALRNSDLTDALDRALTQIPGGTTW